MVKVDLKSVRDNPANPRALNLFNVRVHRASGSLCIGQVSEKDEGLARLAALSHYGMAEEDVTPGSEPNGNAIFPEEEFDVSPA
jgi:hypothetical protein